MSEKPMPLSEAELEGIRSHGWEFGRLRWLATIDQLQNDLTTALNGSREVARILTVDRDRYRDALAELRQGLDDLFSGPIAAVFGWLTPGKGQDAAEAMAVLTKAREQAIQMTERADRALKSEQEVKDGE